MSLPTGYCQLYHILPLAHYLQMKGCELYKLQTLSFVNICSHCIISIFKWYYNIFSYVKYCIIFNIIQFPFVGFNPSNFLLFIFTIFLFANTLIFFSHDFVFLWLVYSFMLYFKAFHYNYYCCNRSWHPIFIIIRC